MKSILPIIIVFILLSTAARADDHGGNLMFGIAGGPGDGELAINSRPVYDDYDKIPQARPAERGLALDLRIGYRLTPGVRAGLEVCGWSRHLDDAPGLARVDYLLAGGGVEWLKGPLNARVVLGTGASRVDYLDRGEHRHKRDSGPGYLVALGFAKRLGSRLAVGPQLVYFGHIGKDTDIWVNSFALMFEIGFFPGD